MSVKNEFSKLSQWTSKPAFLVRDGLVCQVSEAAAGCLVEAGIPVADLIVCGGEEYAAYAGGCLYVRLDVQGHIWNASVHTDEDCHIFILEDDGCPSELRVLALAARELRGPLSDLLLSSDHLLPELSQQGSDMSAYSARMNRSLHRMLRLVGNMSDAARLYSEAPALTETIDVCALFRELLEKACALSQSLNIRITHEIPRSPIFTLADRDKLTRAFHNILSNAFGHMPEGGEIFIKLWNHGRKVYLSVQDSGSGIAPQGSQDLFSRYRRMPVFGDFSEGIGLGMSFILSAARIHGGTVLLEEPEAGGLKVTLSLSIQKSTAATVRSGVLLVDYAGERDQTLIELSDCLDFEAYHIT